MGAKNDRRIGTRLSSEDTAENAPHCVALRCVALRCVALRRIVLHCITLASPECLLIPKHHVKKVAQTSESTSTDVSRHRSSMVADSCQLMHLWRVKLTQYDVCNSSTASYHDASTTKNLAIHHDTSVTKGLAKQAYSCGPEI